MIMRILNQKKSKRGKQSKKAEQHTDDKPFVCERCGVKYKTKPGLSYHIHKAHSNTSNSFVHSLGSLIKEFSNFISFSR